MPETVQESGAIDQADEELAERADGDGGAAVTDGSDATAEPTESDNGEEGSSRGSGEAVLVREGDIAGDYLERLLDLVDYDGDIDLDVEAGRAVVSIDGGDDLEKLVGPRGNEIGRAHV